MEESLKLEKLSVSYCEEITRQICPVAHWTIPILAWSPAAKTTCKTTESLVFFFC